MTEAQSTMPLTTDQDSEQDVRDLLKTLMFRNRDADILTATDRIIRHFGAISDWTELEHSPARYLYECLAPIGQYRTIAYDDLAQAMAEIPALYYRAQAFDYQPRTWHALELESFDQFVAKASAAGLIWRCFETPTLAGDGRILLARLLQQAELR